MTQLPVGPKVDLSRPVKFPLHQLLEGRDVSLKPLDPEKDSSDLFKMSHGKGYEVLWTYMFNGPFQNAAVMEEWLNTIQKSKDPLFYGVYSEEMEKPVGMVSLMNTVPNMRRIEIGNVWYSPAVQRTRVNTEAIFLLLTYCFDDLNFRRVEWKCDALNEKSRGAALRLGFSFEGIFRQHLIVKGKNRDTAWYAMLDSEWEKLKPNYKAWLAGQSSDGLSVLNRKTLGI